MEGAGAGAVSGTVSTWVGSCRFLHNPWRNVSVLFPAHSSVTSWAPPWLPSLLAQSWGGAQRQQKQRCSEPVHQDTDLTKIANDANSLSVNMPYFLEMF